MKTTATFFIFVLFFVACASKVIGSADWVRPDNDYCSGGVCDGDLTVNGNFTVIGDYINLTVTDYNVTGDITVTGDIIVGGNVSADYYIGDGSLLNVNNSNSSDWWDNLDSPLDFLLSMFDGPNWIDADMDFNWYDLFDIDELSANFIYVAGLNSTGDIYAPTFYGEFSGNFTGDGSQLTGIDVADIWVNSSGDTMTGNLIMSSKNITNVSYGLFKDRVGIGTATPNATFHIHNTAETTGSDIILDRYWGGVNNVRGSSIFHYYDATVKDSLILKVAGQIPSGGTWYENPNVIGETDNFVIIKAGGTMGIGTRTPGATIPNGAGAGSRWLEIKSPATYLDSGLLLTRSDGVTASHIWHDGNTWGLFIDNYYNSDAGSIYFRTKTAGTPVNAMTILGSGSVGIGTTTPNEKLTVVGNANITGNISAGLPEEAVTATSMYVCWDIDNHMFLNDTGCR